MIVIGEYGKIIGMAAAAKWRNQLSAAAIWLSENAMAANESD
jgi:hypothetical protein